MSQPDGSFMFSPEELPPDGFLEAMGGIWDSCIGDDVPRWADLTRDSQVMALRGYQLVVQPQMTSLIFATTQLDTSIRARMN